LLSDAECGAARAGRSVGLALLAYGAARATFDVDLLAPRVAQDEFVAYLEARGFATLGVQAGFSNHQHPEAALGRLDVIYVSGTTADAVFAGCTDRTLVPGVEVPVPRPELPGHEEEPGS
jgi:hypothetical protein